MMITRAAGLTVALVLLATPVTAADDPLVATRFAVAPTHPSDETLALLLDTRDCGSSGKDPSATVESVESAEDISVSVEVAVGPEGQVCGGGELTRIEVGMHDVRGELGMKLYSPRQRRKPQGLPFIEIVARQAHRASRYTPSFSLAQLLGPGPDVSAYGIDSDLQNARALVDEGDLVILRGRIRENGTIPLEIWQLRSGEWYQTSGNRRCNLEAVADPNLASAPWSVKRPWPKPSARTITIKVQEWACNSGLPPTGRVLPPTVHYTPDAIYIVAQTIPNTRTWQENAVSGSHMLVDCQGAPPATYTVHLDRRVRDRDLFDGGSFPPKLKQRQQDR